MRLIAEQNKIYNSLIINKEESKVDIRYIDNKYPYKKKLDYLFPILLLFSLALFLLMFVNLFFSIGGVIALALAIVERLWFSNYRKIKFLDYFTLSIVNNGKVNYYEYKRISNIYPIYILCDNERNTFTLTYRNTNYLYMEYDDILNYSFGEDRLEITFNNKKTAEIKLDDKNSIFMKNYKYDYLKEENKNTLINLSKILDAIIYKNRVE